MSPTEAIQVVQIMLTADGGCHVCASGLLSKFVEKFPAYREVAKSEYRREFEHELDLEP